MVEGAEGKHGGFVPRFMYHRCLTLGDDAGEGRERLNGYIFSFRYCLGYCEKFVDKVMILGWSLWLDRGKTLFRSKEEK